MKQNVSLTVSSLLSILFMTLHLTDDILRGMSPGGVVNMVGVLILVVWLSGTLALAGRRSGYVIVLVGAIAKSNGAFLFVWTLLALGVTSIFSVILSARGLWSLRLGQPR